VVVGTFELGHLHAFQTVDRLGNTLTVEVHVFLGLGVAQPAIAAASEGQDFAAFAEDARVDASGRGLLYFAIDSLHFAGLRFVRLVLMAPCLFVAQFALVPRSPGIDRSVLIHRHTVSILLSPRA
jgi:NO-binding membrane sensor protein with MHYT domain